MKKFITLILLALVLTTPSQASKPVGVLGNIDTMSVAGMVFTDLTGLIVLAGNVVTGSKYATLRKLNATSGYQVTAGKTLTIYVVQLVHGPANNLGSVVLGYGDTDVGQTASSAPTTPVYAGGDTTNMQLSSQSTGNGPIFNNPTVMKFTVPANKYPFIYFDSASSTAMVYGYES